MSKAKWIVLAALAALLAAVLVYGVTSGRAGYVLRKVLDNCFT